MSTFAGGGGSSMGYKLAGYDVIAANDIDLEMARHYVAHLHPRHYFLCPISTLVQGARARRLPAELYTLDVLDGSPPCSTFSKAGKRQRVWGKKKRFREGQAEQVLSDLFFDYLDLMEALQPKVSIAENVRGLVIGNAKGYTRLIVQRYREIGYRVQVFLLNAMHCEVPQSRERVFFVARREDLDWSDIDINPRGRIIGAAEALVGVPSMSRQEHQAAILGPASACRYWWERARPGEGFGKAVQRAGLPPTLYSHRRLHPQRPAPTLTARPTFYHWSEPRRLSFREWCRLGTFPDDYQASPRIGCYIVGMSVPPRMAATVARAVYDQWLAGMPTHDEQREMA